jgi:acyl-CoA dehydrogenase family member 9
MTSTPKEEKLGIMPQIFAGGFDHDLIFPYPKMNADEAETVEMLLDSFDEFAKRKINSVKMDEEHETSPEVLKGLFDLGLMGLAIPEEYGGAGLSMTAYCKVMEAVGRKDASLAVTVGGHQSIGMKAILISGNEEQKAKYLPQCADGRRIAAYALTEPEAGSDAGSLKTRAVYDPAAKTFTLNGSKLWITNGAIAGIFTVFAKEELDGKDVMSAFIVEGEAPGLTRGKPELKMGIRASNTTELYFENVVVPEANVLGERGKGFKVALEVLDYGRLSLGAGCAGGIKELMALAIGHATQRRQFGAPISDLQMIRGKIARMAVSAWVADSMVYLATSLVDRGVTDFSIESACCKAYCSERLWDAANDAMQIVGGIGYMSEYPYERLMRDARINMIFEGTNEIQRLYITLAGMKRPGDTLKAIQKKGGIGALIDYSAHTVKMRFATDHLEGVHPALSWHKERVEEWAKAFSVAVDKLLVAHGKKVISMGFLQERVANAAMNLYGMIATLSRLDTLVKARGAEACAYEMDLTKAYYADAWRALRRELGLLERNGDERALRIAAGTLEREGFRVLD